MAGGILQNLVQLIRVGALLNLLSKFTPEAIQHQFYGCLVILQGDTLCFFKPPEEIVLFFFHFATCLRPGFLVTFCRVMPSFSLYLRMYCCFCCGVVHHRDQPEASVFIFNQVFTYSAKSPRALSLKCQTSWMRLRVYPILQVFT